MSKRIVVGVVALVGIILVISSHRHGTQSATAPSPAPSATSNTSDSTAVAQLAVAQLATYSGESSVAIQRALNALMPVCTESAAQIANETHASLVDLANHGILQSAVGFMDDTKKPARVIAPTNCAQVMATLLVLMEKPQN